jgi:hypothetical protein
MRQQLLADLMERAPQQRVDVVSVLHIAPTHNTGFNRVTSPGLREIGDGATKVWRGLLREPDRLRSVAIEELFRALPAQTFGLEGWWDYIAGRYAWVGQPPVA